MTDLNKQALEHAQQQLSNYKKLQVPQPEVTQSTQVCQPGDKECVARLISAFSDCD